MSRYRLSLQTPNHEVGRMCFFATVRKRASTSPLSQNVLSDVVYQQRLFIKSGHLANEAMKKGA
jgi:hypothetical protein